ncbi:hypothetical protein [Azospirillum endophyticum]
MKRGEAGEQRTGTVRQTAPAAPEGGAKQRTYKEGMKERKTHATNSRAELCHGRITHEPGPQKQHNKRQERTAPLKGGTVR